MGEWKCVKKTSRVNLNEIFEVGKIHGPSPFGAAIPSIVVRGQGKVIANALPDNPEFPILFLIQCYIFGK